MATCSSDVLFSNVLPSIIATRLDEWIKKSSSVNIFVTGKTGTGKSTLINGIVGSEVAPEGDNLHAETTRVQMYQLKIGSILVKVWDSPGLQDGTENEEEYLKDIKSNCCGNVDLFMYCVDMSQTRFVPGNCDIKAMQKLSQTLGEEMWKNTLFVLTFANKYIWEIEDRVKPDEIPKNFSLEIVTWKDLIHSALQNEVGLDPELVKTIEVVPAGDSFTPEIYPGDGLWLSKLWSLAVRVTNPLAQPAFVKINEHRLKDHSNISEDVSDLIHEQPLILAEIGFKLGEQLGVGQLGHAVGLTAAVKVMYALAMQNGYIPEEAPVSVDIDSYKN